MKVKLKFAHTHAGVAYPAGAEIDVTAPEALWLKAQDVIHAEWDALKAELKKLATKDNPAPYAEELAKAVATAIEPRPAPTDASAPVASASPAASAAAVPAPAATQESTK